MKYLAVAVSLLSVPSALAALDPRTVTPNAAKQLGKSGPGSSRIKNRQTGEYCGIDSAGQENYCEDPSTTCCTGYELWQCAPITMQECCTTGYFCEAGTFCYLSGDGEQLCLTPEEAEEMEGGGDLDIPDETGGDLGDDLDDLGDDLGFGDDDGDDVGSASEPPADDEGSEETEGDDDSLSGGASGKRKKKGSSGSGGDSGAPKAGAGHILAGIVAFGAVLIAQA